MIFSRRESDAAVRWAPAASHTLDFPPAVLDPVLVLVEQRSGRLTRVDAHWVTVGLHPARCREQILDRCQHAMVA